MAVFSVKLLTHVNNPVLLLHFILLLTQTESQLARTHTDFCFARDSKGKWDVTELSANLVCSPAMFCLSQHAVILNETCHGIKL